PLIASSLFSRSAPRRALPSFPTRRSSDLFIVPAEGFLPRLAEWARENGVVFIADEVQAGFCRTGKWFAVDHEGVEPDLVTLAKGDRKSTRLNSSHVSISYAVFCLKKKKEK